MLWVTCETEWADWSGVVGEAEVAVGRVWHESRKMERWCLGHAVRLECGLEWSSSVGRDSVMRLGDKNRRGYKMCWDRGHGNMVGHPFAFGTWSCPTWSVRNRLREVTDCDVLWGTTVFTCHTILLVSLGPYSETSFLAKLERLPRRE